MLGEIVKPVLWRALPASLILLALVSTAVGAAGKEGVVVPVDRPFFADYARFKLVVEHMGYTIYVYYYHPGEDIERFQYYGFTLDLMRQIERLCNTHPSIDEDTRHMLWKIYGPIIVNSSFIQKVRIAPTVCLSKKIVAVSAPPESFGEVVEEVRSLLAPYLEDLESLGIRVEVYPLRHGPLLLSLDKEIGRYEEPLKREFARYGLNLVPYTGISGDLMNRPYIQVNTSIYLEMLDKTPAEARVAAEQIARNVATALRNIGFPIHEVTLEITHLYEVRRIPCVAYSAQPPGNPGYTAAQTTTPTAPATLRGKTPSTPQAQRPATRATTAIDTSITQPHEIRASHAAHAQTAPRETRPRTSAESLLAAILPPILLFLTATAALVIRRRKISGSIQPGSP